MKLLLVILILVVLALQYKLWFGSDGITDIFHLKSQIHSQEAKNRELEQHNQFLEKEIDSLRQGGEAIENRARNDLGMVKKGEVYYQVVK